MTTPGEQPQAKPGLAGISAYGPAPATVPGNAGENIAPPWKNPEIPERGVNSALIIKEATEDG